MSACGQTPQYFSDYSVSYIAEAPAIEDLPNQNEVLDEVPNEEGVDSKGIITWFPDASRGRETKPECRLSELKKSLRSAKEDVHLYLENFNLFFKKCESQLDKSATLGLLNDLKMTGVRYPLEQNPLVKFIDVGFSNGEKLRAMMALKADSKPRPFVIARCGVYCNIGGRLPRVMVMHLFDETPFNLLVLPSTTGQNYVEDSGTFGIGGYLEATQHLKIAEYLRSSQSGLAERISSVHIVGASLGGNSALMTSVLSDHNLLPSGQRPIDSTFALCPVVDLEQTLDEILKPNLRGFFMSRNSWEVLSALYKKRGDTIPEKKPSIRELFNIVGLEALKKYHVHFSLANMVFRPFENIPFLEVSEVWQTNQFSEFALSVQTPTFAFTADEDPIVPTDINTKKIMKIIGNNQSTQLVATTVPKGRHCAQNIAYGWSTMTEIFRSFILNFDPQFERTAENISLDLASLNLSKKLTLNSHEMHFSQTWRIEKGASYFNINFEIWSPKQLYNCDHFGPYNSVKGCFRTVTVKIPLELLSRIPNINAPKTDGEAQALTRWANSNIEIYGVDKKELHHTRALPSTLSWQNY